MLIVLKKIYTWIKNYWYIPFSVVIGIILLCVGKSDIAKKILEYSRTSNEQQQEEIARIEKEALERKEKLEKEYNNAIRLLDEEFKKYGEDIDAKTKEDIKAMIKKYEDDPEGMTKEFATRFGLSYVEYRDE